METQLIDKVRGLIFGQAIGDALGFGTEYLPRSDVSFTYPDGLRDYTQIRFYSRVHNRFETLDDPRWRPGDWTDDTDLMLCIFDSLLINQALDIKDIATRFYQWSLTDGFGLGGTTSRVLSDLNFLKDPHHVAQQYWKDRDRYLAANGGVMRTSILGIWQYQDLSKVRLNADRVCRITHADPRCIGSCIAVCLAIAQLLHSDSDLEQLLDSLIVEVQDLHPELKTYLKLAKQDFLEAFDLDEGLNANEQLKLGYTLKTLGAAFWCLLHAPTFEEGLLTIIHEGGDADTNAAVAGALLGARFGYKKIPERWVNELVYRAELDQRIEQLITLCDE